MLDKILTRCGCRGSAAALAVNDEQADHAQQDAIQENPGGWMDTHFNGPGAGHDDDRLHDATKMPDNDGHAGKAETSAWRKP